MAEHIIIGTNDVIGVKLLKINQKAAKS